MPTRRKRFFVCRIIRLCVILPRLFDGRKIRRPSRKMAARPPEFEDFMSPIANQNDEAVALRVFVATVAGILVAGIAAGWLFGLAGIGVLAMIATALMLLLTVVITLG
jgi:predicted lipid-binding transport protein (Tim44 family)